ncbi:hypothetical protein [Streptomyces sp. Ag109_O5-1]|uniref:hypothetical protein n=1 Tax=Streptomyces sp. Ag109_O5-1 TaxID=1938851 RepID=UPI0016286309|nr:hypothetical protein [Streptomyces sp. Ag109_O5-1]
MSIDPNEKKVFVILAKQQIKDAPEFDREKHPGDPGCRDEPGTYYGPGRARSAARRPDPTPAPSTTAPGTLRRVPGLSRARDAHAMSGDLERRPPTSPMVPPSLRVASREVV